MGKVKTPWAAPYRGGSIDHAFVGSDGHLVHSKKRLLAWDFENGHPRPATRGSGGGAGAPPILCGERRVPNQDTGTNPSNILHITRRTKPIIHLWRFVSVFQ